MMKIIQNTLSIADLEEIMSKSLVQGSAGLQPKSESLWIEHIHHMKLVLRPPLLLLGHALVAGKRHSFWPRIPPQGGTAP